MFRSALNRSMPCCRHRDLVIADSFCDCSSSYEKREAHGSSEERREMKKGDGERGAHPLRHGRKICIELRFSFNSATKTWGHGSGGGGGGENTHT